MLRLYVHCLSWAKIPITPLLLNILWQKTYKLRIRTSLRLFTYLRHRPTPHKMKIQLFWKKSKFDPVHVMREHRGNRRIPPPILILSPRWRWAVAITLLPLYRPTRNNHGTQRIWWWMGLGADLDVSEKRTISFVCRDSKPGPLAHSLMVTPATLSNLKYLYCTYEMLFDMNRDA
jgi:hypothetical protein